MGEGELETRSHELLDVGALHVLVLLDLGNLEDVDRGETGAVARSRPSMAWAIRSGVKAASSCGRADQRREAASCQVTCIT